MTHTRTLRLLREPLQSVKRRIGELHAGAATEIRMGDITLLPHQLDAVQRLEQMLLINRGALLADEVGLGKTYVALAIAQRYEDVHIIAPAALIPMWKEAIRRTATEHVTLHSMHRVSQREDSLPIRTSRQTLVIADEAHHLRNPHTVRYARIAAFVAGNDLLLLSATPIHNRPPELRALLALFLGDRTDALDNDNLARLVVRRTQRLALDSRIPVVVDRGEIPTPHDERILNAILALPDPLPAHDGTTAGALIRLGLLRAWCSSDAALAHSVRQRRLRGEALRHALEDGKHPSRSELRSWIVGDDSVQLAFPELMVTANAASGSLMDVLRRHLDALSQLQLLHASNSRGDVVRANALSSMLKREPERPIVAFSQFRQTIVALHRALRDIAGVASISAQEGRIASGRISRRDVLHRFAPHAHGLPPPAEHQRVKLLLSTDLLAEGVNLQDAGTVVHLDLPWTDALRRQRVGRCARIGAVFDPVYVYTIAPPPGAESVLRLYEHLGRKAGVAELLIGASTSGGSAVIGARTGAQHPLSRIAASGQSSDGQSPPEVSTALRERLVAWSGAIAAGNPDRKPSESTVVISLIPAAEFFWLASINVGKATMLVAHFAGETSDAIALLAQCIEHIESIQCSDDNECIRGCRSLEHSEFPNATSVRDSLVQHVRTQLDQWLSMRQSAAAMGPLQSQVSRTQRHALALLTSVTASLSPMRRSLSHADIDATQQIIRAARGAGAESALQEWMSSARASPTRPEMSLTSWRESPVLARIADRIERSSSVHSVREYLSLNALIIGGARSLQEYTS